MKFLLEKLFLRLISKLFYRNAKLINHNDMLWEYGYNDLIEKNNVVKIKSLLSDGWNPTVDDNYPIKLASEHGHLEIVQLLLDDPRVDPSKYFNYALRKAVQHGHTEIVQLLLDDDRVKNNLSTKFITGFPEIIPHIRKHKIDNLKI